MPGKDELYFNVEIQSAEATRQLAALQRKFRELGDTAIAEGRAVDTAGQKNIRTAAAEVVAFEKVQQAQKAANEATRASIERSRSNTTVSRSNASVATNNAAVSAVNAGAAPDLAASKVSLAAAKAEAEQARVSNLLQEQKNRNLESEGRQRLLNDKIQAGADERTARAQREYEADFARLVAAEEKEASQRQAAAEKQGALYSKYLEQQEAGIARIAAEQAKNDAKHLADQERAAVAAQRQAQTLGAAEAAAYREQASRDSASSRNSMVGGDPAKLNATRNALYGTATALGIAGAATIAFGAYSVVSATQFQASFADVDRAAELTANNVDSVRQGLVDLSTTLPTSFSELSQIATLGAQLGIAAGDLDNFTSVVAKFSATTNVSSDQAATSFGRISNLLDVNPADFDKLGAAIYQVGIKSVATESEILSMSQQISGAAATYKINAQDVVGLSSAFASLAIAPEAARGSFTRVFAKINNAVHDGGKELQNYADITGQTKEDLTKLFATNPTQFFTDLVAGLSKSADLTKDLQKIGASDVRDQNLFQRLASNPKLLTDSIAESRKAYQEGSALNKGYAVTLDTVAAKLKIFANSFKALGASLGGPLLAPLSAILDLLTSVAKFFSDNPIASGIAGVALAISLLLGGFLLLKAAEAAAIAGVLSLRAALDGLAKDGVTASISMGTLMTQLRGLGIQAGVTSAETTGAAGAFGKFAGAGSALLSAAGPMIIIAAAAASLKIGIDALHQAFDSAGTKSEPYIGTLSGIGDALAADTKAYDEGKGAVTTYTSHVSDHTKASDAAKESAKALSSVLGTDLVQGADASSGAAARSVVAWGDASTAYVKAQLQNNEKFQQAIGQKGFATIFDKIGANTDDAIAAAAKNGRKGIDDYFNKLREQFRASNEGFQKTVGANGQVYDPTDFLFKNKGIEEYKTAIAGVKDDTQKVIDTNNVLGTSLDSTDSKQQAAAQSASDLAEAQSASGDAAADATTDIQNLFSSLDGASNYAQSLTTLFSGIKDGGASFDVLSQSGQANLANLEAAIGSTISYAQTAGLDTSQSVAQLFAQLQASGVDTASLLQVLASSPYAFTATLDVSDVQAKLAAIGQASGGLGAAQQALGTTTKRVGGYVVTTTQNTNGLAGSMAQLAAAAPKAATAVGTGSGGVGKAVKDTAKEVRTLHDYMSDLKGVFDDATEYRFGAQDARNDITKGWKEQAVDVQAVNDKVKDQKKAIVDARQEIKGMNADILELQAKLSQDKYFKKVADRFGDTLRSQQLGADIATDNSDISGKKKDIKEQQDAISDAQKAIKDALKPVTRSIEDQDDQLGDLLGSYQDLVAQWAASGMSSDELKGRVTKLKTEFVTQATQLGYNKTEIGKYSDSFDDLKVAIDGVPKNVTVKTYGNNKPALQALADFKAKANKTTTSPSVGGSGTTAQAGRNGTAAGSAFGSQFKTTARRLMAFDIQATLKDKNGDMIAQSTIGGLTLARGGFVPGRNAFPIGGFVPGATPSDRRVDNVPAMMGKTPIMLQGGEPVSTNAARTKYGDQMFEEINALRFRPNISVINQQSSGSGEVIAHLSAEDRGLLRAAISRPVTAQVSYVDTARAAAKGNAALTFGG